MNAAKYGEIVKNCKTLDELNNLKKNTLAKGGGSDLIEIVDSHIRTRFGNVSELVKRKHVSIPLPSLEEMKANYILHPKLIQSQIEFLSRYQVKQSDLFNAEGKSYRLWKDAVKALGCTVIYGTSPCDKEEHTLRTRSNHCVQCNPENLSYQARHRNHGEVYVAFSQTTPPMVKVGCSDNSLERIGGLNSEMYAGRSDWVRKFHIGVTQQGAIEFAVHAALASYEITGKYYHKDNKQTLCREIFSCPVDKAIEIVKNTAKQN